MVIAKWLLVVVMFSGPFQVQKWTVFFGESEADCKEARDLVRGDAGARGADVFVECVDMKRAAMPAPARPQRVAPSDPASEVKS